MTYNVFGGMLNPAQPLHLAVLFMTAWSWYDVVL